MHKKRRHCDSDDGDNDDYNTRTERNLKEKRQKHDDESRNKRLEDDRDDNTVNYERYKSLFQEIYFSDSDPIKKDSPECESFWIFLKKYQHFQKNKELKESSSSANSYDKKNKNNLSFSTKCDKINKFHVKQEYAGKSRKLTTEELETFESILLLYYDFLQKQKFNKLRKIKQDQTNLPIYKYKRGIIDAINKNQVVVVAGDTGCGKSTQVPQYLMEAGYTKIACTQPRRIACISLAKRVSFETLNEYGSNVAYQVRFDKTKTKATRILFLTEGLLLRQIDNDPTLSKYDVIIMDEVHERHVHTDFLLGIVKCVLHQRPDLKLVLMSATINLELFSRYFDNAPVAKVPGRLYPIELNYLPTVKVDKDLKTEKFDASPYIRVLQLIDKKYSSSERGDVLIFLSGFTEIMTLVEAAREYGKQSSSWIVLPLHSSLSLTEQDKVFDYPPEGVRKCIVSTNIAETSVTIDGVRFVIDSGKVKEMAHDTGMRMGSLKESWISRASAEQRKGRAGRTGPGVCYRLYNEEEYKSLEEYSTPEIRRVPLESLVLQMVVLGIPDPRLFPFIENPLPEKLESSVKILKSQGALTDNEAATQIGKTLAKLPVDVIMGKMLITGCLFETIDPILSIAASLCVQSVFTNKAHRDYEAYKLRKNLESNHGDPLTLHNILEAWLEMKSSGEETRRWCKKRGIEEQRLYEIIKLRTQFKRLLTDHGLLENDCDDDDDDEDVGDRVKRRQKHADRNQLRKLKQEHKNKDRKKKILKMTDGYEDDDDNDADERDRVVGDVEGDIRDLEFRLTNDMDKIQSLLTNSRKAAISDTSLMKMIICSALHPQFAISDEHNTFKPDSQQLYHTSFKSFINLHPTSGLTSDPEHLILKDSDVKDGVKRVGSRQKGKLSHKHQLLAYVTLLETNKPYLINALRVPALQTLLLFSNKIDTTSDLHRLVFDNWIDVEIDQHEDVLNIIITSIRIRTIWHKLMEHKLQWSEKLSLFSSETTEDKSMASESRHDKKMQRKKHRRAERKLMKKLHHELKDFLEMRAYYRIRRSHLAEKETLYRNVCTYFHSLKSAMIESKEILDMVHPIKGGLEVTGYLTYDCLDDDGGFPAYSGSPLPERNDDDYYDGSLKYLNQNKFSDKFNREQWNCPVCDVQFFFITAEKLRHIEVCETELSNSVIGSSKNDDEKQESEEKPEDARNAKICEFCHEELKCSIAEMIRHLRECSGKNQDS